MQLLLNPDLKIGKLEFNRPEQEMNILKMQVFDVEGNAGSRLWRLKFGRAVTWEDVPTTPGRSLPEALHLPGEGCVWGLGCSADLTAGQSCFGWCSWTCVVRSHPSFTGTDRSSNRGQKTAPCISVLQFPLRSYNIVTLQFPLLLPALNNRLRCQRE